MSSLVCGAEDQEAINNFVSYLKIQSVHPEPDYGEPHVYKHLVKRIGGRC